MFDLQSKWPVRAGKRAHQVRSARCKHIVDGVGRSNDALSPGGGGASRQPADDVASLLVVERLDLPVNACSSRLPRGRAAVHLQSVPSNDGDDWLSLWTSCPLRCELGKCQRHVLDREQQTTNQACCPSCPGVLGGWRCSTEFRGAAWSSLRPRISADPVLESARNLFHHGGSGGICLAWDPGLATGRTGAT